MFYVGQAVVCVDAKGANTPAFDYNPAPDLVIQDRIYTISRVVIDDDGTWLVFKGLSQFSGFGPMHFRPLEDRELADISALTEILECQPA